MDFGYVDSYLTKSCKIIEVLYSKKYNTTFIFNSSNVINVCTWNIWGLTKYNKSFLEWSIPKRMDLLIENIIKYDIDILCLQEVSNEIYYYLYSKLNDIMDFYEEGLDIEKNKSNRNRNLENIFIVKKKYIPIEYVNYSIGGNLGYNNVISVLRFNNAIFYNIYLQAGSKHSVGQEKVAHHYSRCRSEQLTILDELIRSYYNEKGDSSQNIFVLGDFNFNLDGTIDDWPELNNLIEIKAEYNLSDENYKYLNSEDTTINFMRYNMKFIDKIFRYDTILSTCKTRDNMLIGQEEIFLDDKQTENTLKYLIYKYDDNKDKVKYNKYKKLSLWISDHFGIYGKYYIQPFFNVSSSYSISEK